jgi:protein phosphatase
VTIELPDLALVLLIGSSGAGKSTFAARHFRPTEIVSSDRCRAMLCDDEAEQRVTPAAFSLLHHIVRARLALGRLTVVDATNLQARARRPLLRLAQRYGRPAVAIVFDLSLETCLARNRGRAHRVVVETALEQHARDLQQALPDLAREGFWGIYRLTEEVFPHATVLRPAESAGKSESLH